MFRYGGPRGMRGSSPNEEQRRDDGPLHMPRDMYTVVRRDMIHVRYAT